MRKFIVLLKGNVHWWGNSLFYLRGMYIDEDIFCFTLGKCIMMGKFSCYFRGIYTGEFIFTWGECTLMGTVRNDFSEMYTDEEIHCFTLGEYILIRTFVVLLAGNGYWWGHSLFYLTGMYTDDEIHHFTLEECIPLWISLFDFRGTYTDEDILCFT